MKIRSPAIFAVTNPRVLAALFICLSGLILGFVAFVAKAAPPVVITVNTLLDDATPGNGLCSLREAITNANDNAQTYPECAAGAGANAITFSVSGTITLGSTLPAINDDLTIDGGGQSVTVSGNNSVRVMVVNSGKTLTLRNLTIANGLSGDRGGGIYIYNVGAVNVINSTFSGNHADNTGGGIENNGMVNVINSTFSGNSAGVGGGILNNQGTVNVINSTFSGNSASWGGGIYNQSIGILNVTNSTFSGNTTDLGGGIFNDQGTVKVINSTFSGNSANSLGGGIYNSVGTATLKNTIIANSTSGGNCSNNFGGTLTADSHDLADDGTCGGATVATSAQINLAPAPANNGGPTFTIALLPGSVAIDAGDETVCAAPPVNEFDQRGVARPADGDGDGISICDIGAFEFSAAAPTPTPSPTPTPTPSPTPSPTPTPTPTPSPTPSPTPTPTPTPSPTPTPTHTPTPTPTPRSGGGGRPPTPTPSPTPTPALSNGYSASSVLTSGNITIY